MKLRVETTNPFGTGIAQMASATTSFIGGQCSKYTGIQRYLHPGLRTNIVLHDFIVVCEGETRYKFATVVAIVGTMQRLMKGMFSRNIGR